MGRQVQFRAGRPHKAFVVCPDATWREFRALCVTRGITVQDMLGDMVAKAVTQDKRAKTVRAKRAAKRRSAVAAEAAKLGVTL